MLYDIGANIGLYSFFAATKGAHVFAFEPEALNFARLNENIVLNGLTKLVQAYPVAIGDCSRLDTLYLHDFQEGAALHAVGEPIDYR
ncbi:MAG: FkbM family methyltransferase, partial [Longimicrobiales bacterium]|nr:FkbM family methyltransferase [Longimicrobiales bacterium]